MTSPAREPGWEHADAEGGVGVIGRGPTLRDAFGQAALAVFGLIADLGRVEEQEVREVRAHGGSLDALLVSWLNECLYVHDVEGIVACRVEFAALDERPRAGGEPFRLHGFLHGEEFDRDRHSPSGPARAMTARRATVTWTDGGFEAAAALDTQ